MLTAGLAKLRPSSTWFGGCLEKMEVSEVTRASSLRPRTQLICWGDLFRFKVCGWQWPRHCPSGSGLVVAVDSCRTPRSWTWWCYKQGPRELLTVLRILQVVTADPEGTGKEWESQTWEFSVIASIFLGIRDDYLKSLFLFWWSSVLYFLGAVVLKILLSLWLCCWRVRIHVILF